MWITSYSTVTENSWNTLATFTCTTSTTCPTDHVKVKVSVEAAHEKICLDYRYKTFEVVAWATPLAAA